MKSFFISQFNYCPIVRMYCQRKSNDLINRIHERALRIAYNDYVSDFDTLLIKDAQWLRTSNIFRQICYSTSEWRGFESRWFCRSGFEFAKTQLSILNH